MTMRSVACFALALLISAGAAVRAEDKAPDLTSLKKEVETVVTKYYPEAKVSLERSKIAFEFNTRKFMIHHALKTGEWQDASEEIGPQKGGILGTIQFVPGKYSGAAVLPQTFNYHYYQAYAFAPYSEKHDAHLHVRILFPAGTQEKFLTEIAALLKDFETFVPKN